MKCTVKKINFAYKMDEFNQLHKEVLLKRKNMKAMQFKEMETATQNKLAREAASAANANPPTDKESSNPGNSQRKKGKKEDQNETIQQTVVQAPKKPVRPDIKDFSIEFQNKFEELNKITMKFNELTENIKKDRVKYGLSVCFITFQTKMIADTVEKNWGWSFDFSLTKIFKLFQSNKYYKYNRNGQQYQVPIRVSRAPDPNDIIFSNIGLDWVPAFTRRILTYFGSTLLLGVSFGATIGLKILQSSMNKKSSASTNSFTFRLISIAITLIISMINYIMSKTIRSLTFAENHWTKTAFYQSLTIKIVLAHVINTSILITLIHILIFKPVDAIYAKGAIMGDAWFMLLSQACLSPLLVYIDPFSYIRSMKRNSLKKKVQSGEKVTIIQEQAQTMYEDGEFDPSFAYASFANILFTSVYFQPILPMSAFTGLIALVLNYYAYKKKLLRDSKRPVMVSDDISEVTLYLLNLMPLVFGISNMIFDKILLGKIRGSSTFFFIMGVVCIVYPLYLFFMNTVKDCISTSNAREINMDVDYDQMRIRFLNEYDRANPVTKEEALQEYFKFMRGKFGLM